MKSNRLHIIFKIFGFLIFSIGIFYVCFFVVTVLKKGTTEGFELCNVTGCSIRRDSGRNLYLCESADAANLVFKNMSNNLPGAYDNVCITNNKLSSNYYTCYTRPAQRVFDNVYGVYRPFDPIVDNDTMAEDLEPSIDTFCASSNGNTQKIKQGIESTVAIYNILSDTYTKTGISISRFGRLIDEFCKPARPSMAITCSALCNNYSYFETMPEYQMLEEAKSAVQTSLNALSNLSVQTASIYNGSKCNLLYTTSTGPLVPI